MELSEVFLVLSAGDVFRGHRLEAMGDRELPLAFGAYPRGIGTGWRGCSEGLAEEVVDLPAD